MKLNIQQFLGIGLVLPADRTTALGAQERIYLPEKAKFYGTWKAP